MFSFGLCSKMLLLTNNNRARKNMATFRDCERCNEGLETVERVLRRFHHVAATWYKLMPLYDFFLLLQVWIGKNGWISNLSNVEEVNGRKWGTIFGVCCWLFWA